jgi:hypothetical protein
MVTGFTSDTQKAMLEATALQLGFKLSDNIPWQAPCPAPLSAGRSIRIQVISERVSYLNLRAKVAEAHAGIWQL